MFSARLAAEAGEDGQIEFWGPGDELHELFSRMLTGQFPNYEAVLPRENEHSKIVIDKTLFPGRLTF